MLPEYTLITKFVAIAFLLFVSAKFLIDGRFSARSNAFALFTLSIAGYLGCQLVHALKFPSASHLAPGWITYIIHVGCFMVPWAFYVLNEALFEDHFRFRWFHLITFIFIEVVHFYLILILQVYDLHRHAEHGAYFSFLRAIPQTVSLIYILSALFRTFSKRRADLVEARRRFRIRFILINSVYMLIVLVSELALQGQKAPGLIEAFHATGILLTVVYFLGKIFSIGDSILGGFTESVIRDKTETPQAPVDQELLQKLQTAMDTGKAYAQESLSIRALAEQLGVHEYLLRRLINAGLGYRNFNDYLNELRIKEAARILTDKEQASTPIIRIAMDLGFGSLAPFNKAFRERQGMTPTEFRKKTIS